MKKNSKKKIKRGDVVVFDRKNFNLDWWNQQSEEDLTKWYGSLGYGKEKPTFFLFLAHIRQAPGHCVLLSLEDQHVETMRHTTDFRVVNDEEF